MKFDGISVKGAREHNLKSINLNIPRNKMTVITGLSGSGKSSIAFDTVYAEGQRRYVESVSAYARNFLEQLKKPEVDAIFGLSPAIAIDQKTNIHNPRSTVGTVTEIYDYLRLLFARIGIPHSPEHGIPVTSRTADEILDEILKLKTGTKFCVLAPVARDKKGEFHSEAQKWIKKGFVRAKVDGNYVELAAMGKLHKNRRHDIDLVIDRLIMKEGIKPRLTESLNVAVRMAQGLVAIETVQGQRDSYSTLNSCPISGFTFPKIEPRHFSFNNPKGACPQCHGLGLIKPYDEEDYEEWNEEDESPHESETEVCPLCEGARIRTDMLYVLIEGKNIFDFANMPASQLAEEISKLKLSDRQALLGEKILQQIKARVEYMNRVGVGYLSLNRPANSLSGGEAQRIRLATQVGSALIGILYVLDEPSIGLHPRDHNRLLEILAELKELGNTILVVEHDEDTIRGADYVFDLGPRAGIFGGDITAEGTPKQIQKSTQSLTGAYLAGKKSIPVRSERRSGNGKKLIIEGARGNNLKDIGMELPLGALIGVSGVSGSGKSTLVIDTLYAYLANHFYRSRLTVADFDKISGVEHLDKVVQINQKAIGRTPRSNPATYVGLLPLIRQLYSQHPEARMRGYKPGRFSFNVKGGRCEHCQGAGDIKVEMHFLSDVFVPCEVCNGRRYNRETLNIKYREKNIADVLSMSVSEARDFFKNHKHIYNKLDVLHRVGLDYISLGQSSTTLSGGEAQRIKLSRELAKRGTGKTLYILDEPTTGLHFQDIANLIDLLSELVDQGNTVVVIEHNLDVLKSCDYLIDLGPDGGDKGGQLVGQGTPETIAKTKSSETGKYLKPKLMGL